MIDPKTGLETNAQTWYDMRGKPNAQTPDGAQSMTGWNFTNGFDLGKINAYAQQNHTGGTISNTGGQLWNAVQESQDRNMMAGTQNTSAQSASEYNHLAQQQGRSDWQTAYRTDVLHLPNETPTQGQSQQQQAQQPQNVPPAPTQQEKTTVTTPEGATTTTKETPTVNTNSSQGREAEITQHLNDGYTNNPALFQDYNTFKQAYNYDTADQGKKAILDSFFKSKTQPQSLTSNDYFTMLTNGGSVTDPKQANSNAYKVAQNDFVTANRFQSATPDQIYQAMSSGQLVPWSNVWNYVSRTNPAAIQKAQQMKTNADKANSINAGTDASLSGTKTSRVSEMIPNTSTATVTDIVKPLVQMSEGIPEKYNTSVDETKAALSNGDIAAKRDSYTSALTDLGNLQAKKSSALQALRTQMEKAGNSAAYIYAKLTEAWQEYDSEIANAQGRADSAKNILAVSTDAVMQLYTLEKDRATTDNTLYQNVANAYNPVIQEYQQKEQNREKLTQSQAEFYQKIKQQAQLSNDPYTAINTVMDEYQKLGVPFTQSIQTKVADAQKFIANGGTIGQYVDQMIKDIQAKPEYKTLLQQKLTGKPTTPSWKQDAQGNWYDENLRTSPATQIWWAGWFTGLSTDLSTSSYVDQYPNEASFKNNNTSGITWNANFDNGTGIAKALTDAGIPYTKGTARPASEGGNYVKFDTIGDGLKAQQIVFGTTYGNTELSTALQKWKWAGTAQEKQQYADSIMKDAGIPTNQSVTYNSLSQGQKDALTMAQIKRESSGLYKVLTTTAQAQWPKQYTDAQLGVMASIDSITPTALKALKEAGLTTSDYGVFKNGGLPPTSSQVASAKSMVDKIDTLLNHSNLTDAVWPFDAATPVFSGKTNDFINKFNSFVANLAKDNLGVLKWPMSDKDVQFVKDMSTTLNRNSDEQSFIDNLNKLKQKYSSIAWGSTANEATTQKDYFSGNKAENLDYNKYF